MTITLQQLQTIMPLSKARASLFLAPLNAAMAEFDINNEQHVEMFLAQLAHETGDLSAISENLNYSSDGLANTWPTRYAAKDATGRYVLDAKRRKVPNDLARLLHRCPIAIANNVYANREGNGSEVSGDGWRHRGAGGIQLTFFNNQNACAEHFGIPVVEIGDWLRTPEGAMRSAAWFWKRAGANELADRGDFDAVSDVINLGRRTAKYGDSIGFHDRAEKWQVSQGAIPSEEA